MLKSYEFWKVKKRVKYRENVLKIMQKSAKAQNAQKLRKLEKSAEQQQENTKEILC